mmetsp:Transcript_53964/g.131039  ORF Transcript_53964/g.131039 Transcript_53964/m.131039 type:complete len:590 (+) Transcript_53964:3375-5144(+)
MSSRRSKLSSTDDDIPNNGWGVTNLLRTVAGVTSAAMLGSYMITNGCGNASNGGGGFPSLLPDPSVYSFDDRFRKHIFASSESSSGEGKSGADSTKKTKTENDGEHPVVVQQSFTMTDLDRMKRQYEKQIMKACQTKDFQRIRWIASILEVVHEIEVLSDQMKQNLDSGRHKQNQSLSAYLNDLHNKLHQALEEEEVSEQNLDNRFFSSKRDYGTKEIEHHNGPSTRSENRKGRSSGIRRKSKKSLDRQSLSSTSLSEKRSGESAIRKRRAQKSHHLSPTRGRMSQKARKLSSHSPRAGIASNYVEIGSKVSSVDTDTQDDGLQTLNEELDQSQSGDDASKTVGASSAVSKPPKSISNKTQQESSDEYLSTEAEFSVDESGNDDPDSDVAYSDDDDDDEDRTVPPSSLKPGSVSKDHWYYSTLENDTVSSISKKLGCDADDIVSLRYNIKNAPDFDLVTKNRNARFKSETILKIPKHSCWALTLEELQERFLHGDEGHDTDKGERWESEVLRGWTREDRPRPGTNHVDRYYFSPTFKFKLRSLAEVSRFQSVLADCGGDEAKAMYELKNTSTYNINKKLYEEKCMHATV